MKRITVMAAVINCLCCLFLFAATSCATLPKTDDTSGASIPDTVSDTPSSAPPAGESKPFTLPYSSMDTVNPFTADTQSNFALCSLLFDGLTALDQTFTAKPNLASSIEQSQPALITVKLRSDAKFSDGSAVKAEDVTASFALAKRSGNYKVLLANIQSARSEGAGTVVFELSSPDPNASACLSFPVIKAGTDAAPLGTGRYVFVKGETPMLKGNRYHTAASAIDVIHLLDVPDSKAMLYSLESGAITYYYTDLADGNIPSTTSASMNVALNSLIFLGANSSKSALSSAAARIAVSQAVNRTDISASAFAGRATPAVSPFHTQWGAASAIKNFEITENVAGAVAQLGQAGYNNTNKAKLSLELLVTEGNSFRQATADLLVQQLAKAGITCTTKVLPFAEYSSRLKKGDFDLYLGEVRLPANMSLRSFFSAGGNTSYGVKTNGAAAQAYAQYLSGEKTLVEFCTAFAAYMPYIPLCWRQGMAAHSRTLTGATPTGFDIFNGFETWKYQ